MSNVPSDPPRQRLTLTHWLILIMAAIGFGFDIYVLLVMQYIGKGSLEELLPGVKPGSDEFNHWRGLLFFVPAFVGGFFGLLGGYLTDLFGRRRVLTGSILLYALAAFASGYSTSLTQLLVFRCLTFIGVCVEFVAAVAWLAELFPNHNQRERVLGYTQAFSSLGGLTVATVFHSMPTLIPHLPTLGMPAFLSNWLGVVQNGQSAWRYTLLSGVLPAIPLILIRPFMPESPIWKQKKLAGTLKRPSIRELFDARFRRTTIVTTIMFACSYGAAFGAIQQTQYMVAAMPQYQDKTKDMKKPPEKKAVENEMTAEFGQVQEIGGLIGRFLLAALVVQIVSRRSLLRIFQVPGLIVVPLVFAFLVVHNRVLFTLGSGHRSHFVPRRHLPGRSADGGPVQFLGELSPDCLPIHLRGTGESFAANIGGRMIGTSFAVISSDWPRSSVRRRRREQRLCRGAGRTFRLCCRIGRLLLPAGAEARDHDGRLIRFADSSHAHCVHHRRRRGHVLRQLHARQHARGGAGRGRTTMRSSSRPTRRFAPMSRRQRRSASSSAASTSIFSRSSASFAIRPGCSTASSMPARLLRWVSRFAVKTQAEDLGELTISMLKANTATSARKSPSWCAGWQNDVKPEIVNLTNVLLSGMVHEVKRELGVPVLGTLQGDDIFLEALPEPYRGKALTLIRDHCREMDGFIATSGYYADFMSGYLAIPRERIHVVYPGLNLRGHGGPRTADGGPPVIGYFARICPEKGLHNLAEAFRLLGDPARLPAARFRLAGREQSAYLDDIRRV